MSKPRSYVGETYSNPFDHGGQTYRWDHKKQEYVLSHGNSPLHSITRAADQKLANKGPIESRGRKTAETPDMESRNYSLWLQNKIVNSQTEREKARWLTQYWDLMGFDQADIIKEERGEGENWIVPERTWQDDPTQVSDQPSTGDLSMFEEDPEDVLAAKVNDNKAGVITPREDPKPISQKYTRPTASERQERRMEDTLVRGRPLEKFKLDRERGRGTDVDDLFTKNREK